MTQGDFSQTVVALNCTGSESSLLDCYSNIKDHPIYCNKRDNGAAGAGVICAKSISHQTPASLGYEGNFDHVSLVLCGVPEGFCTAIVEYVFYGVQKSPILPKNKRAAA